MKARNALKLILSLNLNDDDSVDVVQLAPKTIEQIQDALKEIDAADPRVRIIRKDPKVGVGTCSSLDECYSDTELVDCLDDEGVTAKTALDWARRSEGLHLEEGLNQRWGDDDDPQLQAYDEFHSKEVKPGDHSLDQVIHD